MCVVINKILLFIKYIRDYFYDIRTKGKEEGRVFTKYLILHNISIKVIIKMSKEELSEYRFYMKLQVVAYYSTKITR